MTSYSSLTSRRIFVLGNIRLKAISNSHQCPKYSRRPVFSSSAKQCLLSVSLKPFLMQTEQQTQERQIAGEDLTPKNPLERERRLEILIQRRKQQRWRRHQQTAE